MHALTVNGHVMRTSTRARTHSQWSRDVHKHTRTHTYARTQAHAHAHICKDTSTRARHKQTTATWSRDAHAHICKDTSTRARIAHSQSHSHVTRTHTRTH